MICPVKAPKTMHIYAGIDASSLTIYTLTNALVITAHAAREEGKGEGT